MKPCDDPQVAPWIEKMREDSEAIDALRASAPHLHAVICFHAQQAAEKALKAALVAAGKKVVSTHRLMEILDLLVKNDAPGLEPLAGDCALLSRYAVLSRYPLRKGPNARDENAAVEASRRIITAVNALLGVKQ